MITNLFSLPYELARKPLAVADDKLSGKLPEQVGSRVGWALGSADKVAGTLLRNPDLAQRGADRVERSSKLLAASRLEEEAEARRERARQAQAEGFQEAARKREAAQDRAASGLDEAQQVEGRGKQEAKERATRTAASKKAAADKRAAGRKSSAERSKDQATSAAEAKRQTAQRRAKRELDDARGDERAAGATRADAERLSELTEVTKQDRKED